MRYRKLAGILCLIWAVLVAVLMLLPSDAFPKSDLLSYDKLAHIAVFGICSFLLCYAMSLAPLKKTIRTSFIAFSICTVYSSSLEYLQQFVPGRMFDTYDFIANFTGGLVGVIFFSIFIRQKFVIDKLIL